MLEFLIFMGSGHWSVQSYTPISICTTRRHQGAPRGVGRRPKNHRPLQLLWLRFCRFSVRCDGLVRNYANRKIATQRYPKIPCIYNFLINGIIILISKATRRGRCIFFFFVRYYYLPRKLFQLLPFGVWAFRFKRAEPDVSINSIAV